MASARNGATAPLPRVGRAGVHEHAQDHEPAVDRLGQERHRRRRHHVGDRRELLRGGVRSGDETGDRLRGRRQDQDPADDAVELGEAEPEPGRHAEVAAAAADRPEQVGLGVGIDGPRPAIGRDDLRGEQ